MMKKVVMNMTVKELVELLDDWEMEIKVNTVNNDEWQTLLHCRPFTGMYPEIMKLNVISWGVYDSSTISIRV